MANHLNEMEYEGLILVGRVVQNEFESAEAIEQAADRVSELAAEHGVPLSFVYAGTTGNWPEQFEYTPCLVGIVTHVDYGSNEADGKEPLPRSALVPRAIPDAVWEALRAFGLELDGETGTYLTVAGWSWTQIRDADGKCIVGISAEDDGYVRIDGNTRLMEGDEPLTMCTSYC